MLRRLGIRPRPFYNTRHTYISFAVSLGEKVAFICAQTGTSPAMVEKHYGRCMPQNRGWQSARGGTRRSAKPDVAPSRLRRTPAGVTTGDMLITKPDQGETESNQDELSRQKTEDSD
jgi:hypothetical protein